MTDFDHLEDAPAPYFVEPKDDDPRSEFDRQRAFLSLMAREAPAVDVVAIPNAGKSSDWQRLRRWLEGARRGALDVVVTWKPTRPGDRGVFFAEFKDGDGMATPSQDDRLQRYTRMGHGCGVYRTAECLVEHLKAAGAPFAFG